MKKLLIALLVIIIAILSLAAVLWFKPGIFLNEKNLARVADSAELDLTWQQLELDFKNTGVLSKEIAFRSNDFCLKHLPLLDFCFEKIHLQFHFALRLKKPYVAVRDLDLELQSKKFYVTFPEQAPEQEDSSFRWPRLQFGSLEKFLGQYLAYLPKDTIKRILIQVDPLIIEMAGQNRLTSALEATSSQDRLNVKAQAKMMSAQREVFLTQLTADLSLDSPIGLQARGHLNLPGPGMRNELELNWQERPEFTVQTAIAFKKMKTRIQTEGILKPEQWTFRFSGDFRHSALPFEELGLRDCPLQLHFQNDLPARLNWPCTLTVSNLRVKKTKGLPRTLDFLMNLSSSLNFDDEDFSANPLLSLKMQKSALGELSLRTQLETTIDLDKRKIEKLRAEELTALLRIPSLTSWERLLKDNRWAIPAPLNVLKGSIQLTANGEPTELLRKDFVVRARLVTELASKTQALKTESDAALKINLQKPEVALSGTVLLKDIAIDLPYLGIEQPPQFKPDSRFITKQDLKEKIQEEKTDTASSPSFLVIEDIRIQTAQPMRFSTRLLPNPIPIDVSYRIRNPTLLSGRVLVRQMDLELFKKKATLQKFNVRKYKNSDVQDLDGLITYKTSEVLIKILIVGTTEKPTIELLSDPPLSRQQILSVLLYNKSLQQLADEEKSTASQMDQALLNNAFGLLSLFFLSSTPIESVYYDPTTQSYTAQVRLDDQTSLSLGSDFEKSQQFTLRRRLGGPWSISTELEQTEDASDVVTTLVEWFKRF